LGAEGCSASVTSGNIISACIRPAESPVDDSADIRAAQYVLVVARGEIGNKEPAQDFVGNVTHSTERLLEEW
jgi:hypothetical protein